MGNPLKTIIEVLPYNILVIDFQANILATSSRIAETVNSQELIGRNFLDITEERLATSSLNLCHVEFKHSVQHRVQSSFHARSRLTDKLYFLRFLPIVNEELMLVTADEVCSQESEKALLTKIDSYQIFKQMVESIGDYAIFMLDPDGYVITWNKGAERLKLYTEQEILGQHFSIFYSEEDRKENKPAKALEIAMTEGRFETEDWRMKADGSFFFANVVLSTVYGDDKKMKGFVKVTQDLTHRLEMQNQIEDQVNQRSNHLRVSFLAHVSHELRNHMHAVTVSTDLLNETQISEQQRPYIDILLQTNLLLNQLLNDILDYSRFGAAGVQLQPENVNIIQLTESVVRPLQIVNTKDLEIKLVIEPHVPRHVIADQIRLIQILSNILNNAIKFTEKGSIVIALTSSEIKNELFGTAKWTTLQFSISDTGIGVRAEQLARLFVPFSQSTHENKQNTHYGGSGLGLAICKKLVEAMNGKIGMQSQYGKGSTIMFSIQVEITQPQNHVRSDSPILVRHSGNNEHPFDQFKVLIVEDNPVNQLLLCRMLEQIGVKKDFIQIADDGSIAVKMIQENEKVDVIFMDLNMKSMGGVEAAFHIHNIDKTIPIYAMTANGFEDDRKRCEQVGMAGFLLKPLHKKNLIAVLQAILDSKINL